MSQVSDLQLSSDDRRKKAGALALVTCVLLLSVLPLLIGSYYQGLVVKMMIFGLFASSLNLILGYAGLASLGHAAYFGIGAYALAKVSSHGIDSFWLQLAFAVLVATVTAAVFSLLILRAQGAYLLMITLALAQILWGIAFGWREFTGGDDGIPGLQRPVSNFLWNISDDSGFYYLVLLVFSLAILWLRFIVGSPFGRVLVGIRENEKRMLVLGYNVWIYKYVACLIAGLLAGIAGALLTWHSGFAGPGYLSIAYSAVALIMVILGGAGTFAGPLVGAFCIVGLENFISAHTDRWLLVLGTTYVLVTLFAPQGLVGLYLERTRRSAG